jgi:peptidoglycan/LPS O-acetylase OafA/YrhL
LPIEEISPQSLAIKRLVAGDAPIAGLDGLRAFAVLLVVLFHQYLLPVGWIGVQIFFVLSGYLISRVLVRDRGPALGSYLRTFYGRRALRIFPLYYATLAILAVASIWIKGPELRDALPFAATYTYNFWYAAKATAPSQLLTHFWTLCVEEQFYLVWPFVMYFVPRRHLRLALIAVILVAPFARLAVWNWVAASSLTRLWDPAVAVDVLSSTHADAFATGALLALTPLRRSNWLFFGVSALLILAGQLVRHHAHLPVLSFGFPFGLSADYAFMWGYSLINIAAALCIVTLAERRLLPRLFEWRPIARLGKISYGLYVIHYPVQAGVTFWLPHLSVPMRLGAQLAVTVSLAHASYELWEKRFLRLKDVWFPSPVKPSWPPPAA